MPIISLNRVEYAVEWNEPIIHLFGRDIGGTAHHIRVSGFRPYCYAPVFVTESRRIDAQIDRSRTYPTIDRLDAFKVYTKTPGGIKRLRDSGISLYEADVPYPNRFLIDRGITTGVRVPDGKTTVDYREVEPVDCSTPARICMIDIECSDEHGFPKPTRDPIFCITAFDSFSEVYTSFVWSPDPAVIGSLDWRGIFAPDLCARSDHEVWLYPSETALLRGFLEYLTHTDPDILSGWNIDGFDYPYIIGRMKQCELHENDISRMPETEIDRARGRNIFDLLSGYKKIHVKAQDSYKLGAVAERELGREKISLDAPIHRLFRENQKELLFYNLVDVELCVEIDKKDAIIEFYREVAGYVGISLDRAIYPSNLIDMLILRRANGKTVLPSKVKEKGKHTGFKGAQVFDAVSGVYTNVVVFDLKSLYPMSMLTVNASYETKDSAGDLSAPNGIRFKSNPPGLMRTIIMDLLEERSAKKRLRDSFPFKSPEWERYDRQQNAVKVIMNSYYGVSGYPGFRLYDPDIAAAITSIGREMIGYTRSMIEKQGYQVLYGDTDSCMVQIPGDTIEEVIESAQRLEDILNQSYKWFAKSALGADEHFFSIRFEKIYRKFFQPGVRKRYAGNLVWKEGERVDIIDVVGFELKRSDSSLLTRKVQERVFDIVFETGDLDAVRVYLRKVIRKFQRGEYPIECIAIPGGFSKPLNEYLTADSQVRGAYYANAYLGTNFGSGDKVKKVYISSVAHTYPKTDVLCFEDGMVIPDVFRVDLGEMLTLTLRSPLTRILDSLNLTWEQVDPSYTTLFDFGN